MNNKVKFLRGTSNEYAVAEKDNDTIYFTTDDGKLYIGDKEVSGSDIIIDDTLSDTSENPVQGNVIKQAIDNKADKTVATTSADGLMSASDKSKLDDADNTYALKSKYGDTTINVGRKDGSDTGRYSTAEGYNTTASGYCSHAEGRDTTASSFCSHAGGYNTTALHNHEVAYGRYNESNNNTLFSIGDGTADDARHNAFEITTTGGKLHDKDIATTDDIPDLSPYAKKTDVPNIKVNAAVNADTVGGKLPEKIFYDNGFSSDLDSATKSGCYAASPDTLNAPLSSWWVVDTMNFDNQYIVQKAHEIGDTANTVSHIRNYANNAWSDWTEIYTAGNKPYITGEFSGTAVDIHLDYEPSFAIVSDEGNIKFGNITVSPEGGYDIKFVNLSDTTHQFIIFK